MRHPEQLTQTFYGCVRVRRDRGDHAESAVLAVGTEERTCRQAA
jgi:hypothetical protein